MLTRRLFCGCVAASAPFVLTPAHAQGASECAVFTPARQKETSPAEAIAWLKAGNERFVAGKTVNCDLLEQAKETAAKQAPFAAIVGCIDSRVPPELVFDQRIGDVFCARVAGNFVNTDIIGSLEYSAKVAGAKAIVVLGHVDCGAIKSAIDNVQLGNITALLANIKPAVAAVGKVDGGNGSHNKYLVQKVTEANARMVAENITRRSPILKELVYAKQLAILAAVHDLASGKVFWLG
jgi:carbonic anhydrase